jgi:hypothetical protein
VPLQKFRAFAAVFFLLPEERNVVRVLWKKFIFAE